MGQAGGVKEASTTETARQISGTKRSLIKRVHSLVAIALCMGVLAALADRLPVNAQTDPETTVELLRDRLEQIELKDLKALTEIDTESADLEILSEGLAGAQQIVGYQTARLLSAQRALEAAELSVTETTEALIEIPLEIERTRERLKKSSIASFVGRPQSGELLFTGNPVVLIREQQLGDHVLASEADLQDALKGLEEELLVQKVLASEAILKAKKLRTEEQAVLVELEADRDRQAKLVEGTEDRLDHLLSEREALATLGTEVARDLSKAEQDLIEWLANSPDRPPTGSVPPLVPIEDIEDAGKGVLVHKSIRKDVAALLEAAAADGVDLAGGGHRSSDRQIELRKKHCGTSHYAIYEMSPSKCRPPTARPGRSKHERGLAIDFTYNGKIITSRSGEGWNWLKANAGIYGLKNLPSEPWHFSIDGT